MMSVRCIDNPTGSGGGEGAVDTRSVRKCYAARRAEIRAEGSLCSAAIQCQSVHHRSGGKMPKWENLDQRKLSRGYCYRLTITHRSSVVFKAKSGLITNEDCLFHEF